MTAVIPNSYNVADHFLDRHLREGRGDKLAIVCEGRSWSYAAVAALANRVGNGLLSLGLQAEQRVLILLPDCPEFAGAYFGVMKIGAVAVPASTDLRAADYDYLLGESRAQVLIVHSSLFPEVATILATQRYLRHVITVGEPQGEYLDWDEWLQQNSAELKATPTSKDDVAFWVWTSGSTGRPKAAVHLHQDWTSCCENYARQILQMGPNDVTFSSSKLFHAYGLGNGLMFPFHVGATTILFPGRARATNILETAQKTKPTIFFSVPTLYARMLEEAERGQYDLNSIRLAVSASEPLPAEIFHRWHARFGREILDGIGSTEVLHIYISPRPGNTRPGSTGQAVPGYLLRIVDPSGQDVQTNCIGDLLVSGESTAPCYWHSRAMTAECMRGRWFFTGDKYWMDADGFYWYAGRSDDMFRVSGQWVAPIEVENALMEHACVLEAGVVAYREETQLLTPKAFIVLRDRFAGTPELSRELQDFVKQRLARHKCPPRIEFVAELPTRETGKLLRYKLRETCPNAIL
jgi:benzoate-CoA ligase